MIKSQDFVKLYTDIRDDPEWENLPEEAKAELTGLSKDYLRHVQKREFAPEFAQVKAGQETEEQFRKKARDEQSTLDRHLLNPVFRGAVNVGMVPQKLGAFALDAVGADETAKSLLDRVSGVEQTVQEQMPGLNKNISEMDWSDASEFITSTLGENLPLMAATAGLGSAFAGTKAGASVARLAGGGARALGAGFGTTRKLMKAAPFMTATYLNMSLPEVYSSVEANGGGALMAAIFAAPHALIENVAGITPAKLARIFSKKGVQNAGKKGLKSFILQSFKDAGFEGMEEMGQGAIERLAKQFANKPYDRALADFVKEMQDPKTWDEMATEFYVARYSV